MTDDEYLQERLRAKRPFENDAHGLRGPQPVEQPVREFLGQIGGFQSYQTAALPIAPDPIQSPQAAGNQAGGGATKVLTVAENGQLNDYIFQATFKGQTT